MVDGLSIDGRWTVDGRSMGCRWAVDGWERDARTQGPKYPRREAYFDAQGWKVLPGTVFGQHYATDFWNQALAQVCATIVAAAESNNVRGLYLAGEMTITRNMSTLLRQARGWNQGGARILSWESMAA